MASLQSSIKSIQNEIQLRTQIQPTKTISNNQILGPPLIPTQTPGAINKIPILPIVAGVGVLVLAGVLLKKRKR